ncbi:hypothetical protein EMIHUDRAFT_256821 [Emiliania huxleyi CCMP1516]|uniref:BZIP domain-containing protein n=2 Tax=Emiliania huxleyi TaxID=2903 RepID=A0A0D3IQ79_EMIH1|nr:hypothetical protein EMIHUDRAFT_256821 [Emiliania huxleyi CCMP1516]EOD13414.1 hypothetical protein EMIHUDRAFT_256821 [Emiliania huxleyi CCMP1516]|eukprot:XP_005765843.1 hypothetical protein EMIHUDRAFT_256821 [Emiliania huxleyi CCMP1516]
MMLLFVYVLYKEKGERGFRGAVLQEYAAVQASSLKMQMGAQQVRLTKLKRENDRLKEQCQILEKIVERRKKTKEMGGRHAATTQG